MDPLASILAAIAIARAVPLRFESSGPYAMRFAGYEHLKFGAVLSGEFVLEATGTGGPVRLQAGDCYLLTDGRPYRTFSGSAADEIDGTAFFAGRRDREGVVRLGDGSPDKIVVGGRFSFDPEGAAWLREALPPLVHIAAGAKEAEPLRATLALLRTEFACGGPGHAVVVDRLADLLLVQAIRAYLAGASPQAVNWLAGIADPRLGRSLREFHRAVAAPWTVASLAAAAGMSRSSFAERFRARVGMAPLDYVTRWRLYRVRRALLETDRPFAVIAFENGYRSRASCSQSFRRRYGEPPASLRERVSDTTALPDDRIRSADGWETRSVEQNPPRVH